MEPRGDPNGPASPNSGGPQDRRFTAESAAALPVPLAQAPLVPVPPSVDGESPTVQHPAVHSGGFAPARNSRQPLGAGSRVMSTSGRFAAGQVLADRYQIISLLGRGGMAEVYRADDLRLGEPVALKFLFDDDTNAEHLQRLFDEVKISREVTHPNVCRVHDVGEVRLTPDPTQHGLYFISMEYIDGENVLSLLKRIGRFSGDSALKISREICAGLAAAHEKGVLHRDLKPANVMIDNHGVAKLTDFGLAGFAQEVASKGRAAGTPLYMAPEQLIEGGASVQSDIYSLGLVLYEVYTGKPVFTAQTIEELRERHSKTIVPPSELLPSIDPDAERAILACLEREPSSRPRSALEVLAKLPGGDPLAAAIAAGQIPSVALVESAGRRERSTPARILSWCALAALMLCAVVALRPRVMLVHAVPLHNSPEVLAADSRKIIEQLGYEPQRVNAAYGLDLFEAYLQLLNADPDPARWERLAQPRPGAMDFWYRQHPRSLAPLNSNGIVSWEDPPVSAEGIDLRLDPLGRLRELRVAASGTGDDSAAMRTLQERGSNAPSFPQPDPLPLFTAAGLDLSKFKEVAPARIPYTFADTRRAWEGVYPESPDVKIRVEAGWFEGRPVEFRTMEPSFATDLLPVEVQGREAVGRGLDLALRVGIVIGAIVLAQRNWRLKRGDYRGALRIAVFFGFATFFGLLLSVHSLSTSGPGESPPFAAAEHALFVGLLAWIAYVAVEPYARRTWPETLIAWSRLLAGRVRDPLVGESLLLGVAAGCGGLTLMMLSREAPRWMGGHPPMPLFDLATAGPPLHGLPATLGMLCRQAADACLLGMAFLLALVLFRTTLRDRRWAIVMLWVVLSIVWGLTWADHIAAWPFVFALAALVLFSILRLGLLATVVGIFVFTIAQAFPITTDAGAWYFPIGVGGLALIAILATLGTLAAFLGTLKPVPR